MICLNTQQVYEYYAYVAIFYSNRGLSILKTDTHNESKIFSLSIPLAPILNFGNQLTCIEIDEDVLAKARHNFPTLNLMRGDIRKLNEDAHYDLLLDFSTIDHVTPEELPSVLRGYRKVAEAVSVIVWLSDTRPSTDKQFYFENWQFRKTFYDLFGVCSEILLFSSEGASLVHFITEDSKLIKNPSLIEWLNIPNLIDENKRSGDPLAPILNSKSWRITAPLRSLSSMVKKIKPKSYHWEYSKDLDYRYDLVKNHINFKGLHVVDLCSGYTGLYNSVKDDVASYRACDLSKLHPISEQMADDDFVKTVTNCDVLCAFGHGGYEISGEELESRTLTSSIHFLIQKFKPRWVVLESVDRFFPIILDIASRYRYHKSLFKHDGPDWLHKRTMLILGPNQI